MPDAPTSNGKAPRDILVVIPSLAGGGAERVVSTLTQEWAREHRVKVAVFDASRRAYPHGGSLLDLEAPAARGPGALLAFARRIARLRALLRHHAPDEVFAFMESANVPTLLAAKLAGYRGRLTLGVRGNPDRVPWFHRMFARRFYGFASRVAANSREGAALMARGMPFGASRVRVLDNPLPVERIEALASAQVDSPETPYFFAAGRLDAGKDFAALIEIFAVAETAEARLVIAGEGPERRNLEARIARLGLDARVRLLGRVENPFAWMRGARALAMTSRHEGFPNVVIEAFACGCPVVAFDCDFGPREIVRDGENGFLVAPADRRRFAARLSELAFDTALRDRLGRAGRNAAEAFEARETARRWLAP